MRQYSLIRLKKEYTEMRELIDFFHRDKPIIFLGEIPNMPGHGVFAIGEEVVAGYHVEQFEEIPEEEV